MSFLQTFKTYKSRILVTIAILLCAGSAIGVKAYRSWRINAELAEVDQMKARAEQVIKTQIAKMTPDQLRVYLADRYKSLVQQANPSLNGIEVYYDEWPRDRSRFRLYAHHAYFSKYSFSAGPLGRHVEQWEQDHRPELNRGRRGHNWGQVGNE